MDRPFDRAMAANLRGIFVRIAPLTLSPARRLLSAAALLPMLAAPMGAKQVAAPAAGLAAGLATVTLSADATQAPVQSVVHLTATIQTATQALATGSVTFVDGGQAMGTIAVDPWGRAVLALGSLTVGPHRLTATYSGDAGSLPGVSNGVSVTITALPAAFTLTATPATIYPATPVTLSAANLVSAATGSVAFTDGGVPVGSATISGVTAGRFEAFGDSITEGAALADPAVDYVSLVGTAEGLVPTNHAAGKAIACDLLIGQMLPGGVGPRLADSPLYAVTVGSFDSGRGSGSPEALFRSCHQADLAWLGIPRELKVLAGDAGASVTSGTWVQHAAFDSTTYGTLLNTTGSGSVRFAITTMGGPIYLWHLLKDGQAGAFLVSIDGLPQDRHFDTAPQPAIGGAGVGFALVRLPVASGPHTVDLFVETGTVGILGVATPPSPASAGSGPDGAHPLVLTSDIPFDNLGAPAIPPALLDIYNIDDQADILLLAGDGLDLRLVNTRQFLLGATSQYADGINPNAAGHALMAAALESVLKGVPTAGFSRFTGAMPSIGASLGTPGVHTLGAAYSGDRTYSRFDAAPVTVNVLPQIFTSTKLSTSATHFVAGAAVTFTATVSPATVTGTVTLFDGTQHLGQMTLAGGIGSFTSSTLASGIRAITASYGGDVADASSASPALNVEIDQVAPSVMLAALPGSIALGTSVTLAAGVTPATATGSVTFVDSFVAPGATQPQMQTVGQGALSGGTASFSTSGLGIGSHSLSAQYSGDANDAPAASAAETVRVTGMASGVTLAAIPASLVFGAPLNLAALVTPSSATGSVMFVDSVSGTLGQSALVNGAAAFTAGSLAIGAHALSAIYSGDDTHVAATSAAVTTQVTLSATTVTLRPLPGSVSAGSGLNLSASLSPAAATGSVSFRDATRGGLGQATLSGGTASVSLASPALGGYSIVAVYGGDGSNSPATSAAVSTQVVENASTTTLGALAASSPAGAALTLTASVTPASASGAVTFVDDVGGQVGLALLVNGSAAVQTSSLAIGPHRITANYSGDSANAASNSPAVSTVITQNGTATSVTLARQTVPAGSPVVFNVRVAAVPTATPTGSVTIRTGATILASGALANGSGGAGYATLSAASTPLGLGSFAVVAAYSGDAEDAASDSSAVSFTIAPIPTAAVLTLAAARVPVQTAVAVSVAVSTAGAGVPTGSVNFLSHGTVFASVAVDGSGQASATLSAQPLGSYDVTANFVPTGLFGASTATQSLTVTPPFNLSFSPGSMSVKVGSSATATLVVTPLSGFTGGVQAQCRSSVSYVTCSVDAPDTIGSASAVTAAVHLAVSTTLASRAGSLRGYGEGVMSAEFGGLFALILQWVALRRRNRGSLRRLRLLVALRLLVVGLAAGALLGGAAGCAEGGNFNSVPAGAETVTVIATTAGGTTLSANLTVNVTP